MSTQNALMFLRRKLRKGLRYFKNPCEIHVKFIEIYMNDLMNFKLYNCITFSASARKCVYRFKHVGRNKF